MPRSNGLTAFDTALFSAPSAGGYSAPAHHSAAAQGGTGYSAPLPPASNVDYGDDGDTYGAPVHHGHSSSSHTGGGGGSDGDSYGAPVHHGHSSSSHTGFGFRADDIGNIDLTSGSSRVSQDAAQPGPCKLYCIIPDRDRHLFINYGLEEYCRKRL